MFILLKYAFSSAFVFVSNKDPVCHFSQCFTFDIFLLPYFKLLIMSLAGCKALLTLSLYSVFSVFCFLFNIVV